MKKTKKVELNADYMHEACDRTYVLMESFESHVIDHPAVSQTPKLAKLASEAFDKMFRLYQESGLLMSDMANKEPICKPFRKAEKR